jgi:hypothetical protein
MGEEAASTFISRHADAVSGTVSRAACRGWRRQSTMPSSSNASARPKANPKHPRHGMRKGTADPHRCTQVSRAANRYLRALAAVEDEGSLHQPVQRDGRRRRALNPVAPADAKLIARLQTIAVCRRRRCPRRAAPSRRRDHPQAHTPVRSRSDQKGQPNRAAIISPPWGAPSSPRFSPPATSAQIS